jgi:hypothetical protein
MKLCKTHFQIGPAEVLDQAAWKITGGVGSDMKLKSDVGLTSLTETMDVPTLGTKGEAFNGFGGPFTLTLGALFICKWAGPGCPIIQFWEKF